MKFHYSKENLNRHEAKLQRFLEILPGAASWTTLLGLVFLSISFPFTAACLIVAFYLSWILRLLYSTIFLVLSYTLLNIEKDTDWMRRIHGIDNLSAYLRGISTRKFGSHWQKQLSHKIHLRQLDRLLMSKNMPPQSGDIHHLVIFPVIKEGLDILGPAIDAVSLQHFPLKRMVVVLALEERASPTVQAAVYELEKKYKNVFLDCVTVVHPAAVPGEARVKGANITCAAKQAARFFDERRIPFENVIVSCFDADTVVSPNYFVCLTYHFMVCPERLRASFQPIPVYHNNIWNVPGFARVVETGSSFYQLIESTNPEKLVTFSSHSMSFEALVDVDYWPVDMISDDSAIFWKAYIHYDGQYRVVPMYVTLSMDVASSDNWWKTMKSIYKQKQRWAWGVENFPIVTRAFLKSKKIPLYDRLRLGFKLFEGHMSWSTSGFILSFIGWLPLVFARREFASSVAYYNVPDITTTIFSLAFFAICVSIILSLSLLPKTKIRYRWLIKLGHAFEWLMVPFILLFFSAMPALHAQTRLMLGKYLEFWVTDKKRIPRP
ncbi:MAG: glycosyltransferase family 2 protein [Candidatus Omnitrophica bacterium]|nr:glycosyltransferase family 2 protein [Candidatus Omnitrophota bacterium]MDE2008633.1 glycosyltransferase family 2 protein [Candidatus Omnitrophota bacterium]MDE2214984.1 glycosyltransferase family 2 protein [Candidatus Omnitrophota bacterium]MDE2230923.1 glycosyltransferase family 2 protein [Candidatus Omnitrophota bacterium]